MDEEAGVGAEAQGDLCRPLEGLLDEGAEWDPEAISDLSYEPCSLLTGRTSLLLSRQPLHPFPWCLLCKTLTS